MQIIGMKRMLLHEDNIINERIIRFMHAPDCHSLRDPGEYCHCSVYSGMDTGTLVNNSRAIDYSKSSREVAIMSSKVRQQELVLGYQVG